MQVGYGALVRCTGLEVVTALADCGKRPQECIRIVLCPTLGAISSTSAVILVTLHVAAIPRSALIAPAMSPDLLLVSGLVDLAFAGPLPPHRRNDDKYDTDEEDDDAEGRERDYDPLLLLALIRLFVPWFGRLLTPALITSYYLLFVIFEK